MASERERLLELALESLLRRKKEIDEEIDKLSAQMKKPAAAKKGRPAKAVKAARAAKTAKAAKAAKAAKPAKKRARFSKEERLRRSKRMKLYWDNWRKQKKSST